MHAGELAKSMRSAPCLRPVLVIPYRSEEEITSRTKVHRWQALADEDGMLTSLSGLVIHCSDVREEKTFLVRTSRRKEGGGDMEEDSRHPVPGDVDLECNFNNRMGACCKDVSGYVGSVFADGTYRGVAVSNSPVLAGSMDEDMEARTSVFFLADLADILETPLEEPLRLLCRENGYDLMRALEEPIWGHGSICGSVALRADLFECRLGTGWLQREEQEKPPFLSSEDVRIVESGKGLEHLKNRDVLCGPVCGGAISKGLRRGETFLVEPCGEITVVINATVKGAVDVLGRLKP